MRIRHLLVAASTGVVLTGTALAPATAATGYNRCPDLRMCVFSDRDGGGAMAYFNYGDVNLGDSTGPTGMNDNIESIWNRSGHNWEAFSGTNYNGTHWTWQSYRNPGNLGQGAANQVSSLYDN